MNIRYIRSATSLGRAKALTALATFRSGGRIMRRFIPRRPSAAMAVAFVALTAALTGTAMALPGTNTVTSDDIVDGQVMTQDIANDDVRGADVRNDTLTGADVSDNSLGGSDINEATLGVVPNANRAGSAGNVLATTVDVGCTVNSDTGGIGAVQTGTQCIVTFPRSVASCTVLVSPFIGFTPAGGEAMYEKLGGARVQVGRFDSAGGSSTAGAFSILAVCPA